MVHSDTDWQPWYDAHAARLVLYARHWLRERADAEDAVQAGFVRFWKSCPRPDTGEVPLLFAAVRTAALDLARSRRRRVAREGRAARDSSAEWWDADSLVERERAEAVQRALEALPKEQRESLILRVWGGLTFAEVARVLQANVNTVASRYRAALSSLQKSLPEIVHDADR
ncbi:MAG: sigma-70 family RNA polymerase sigma factor [Planctomycetes bacterium]|nr:sigma-70 family RNA polymerase sigma factor [Planctomycetota bacterium]